LLLVVTLLAVGCSQSSGVLSVVDSWAPTTPPNAPTAVIYLTIDNGTGTGDRLVGVETDRCATTELHATQIDDENIMRMRLAEPALLEIPSDEALEMIPGGLHVMCIDPPTPFVEGESLELTVTLENAGPIDVTTPVENR
jgi:hypothetical protein